MQNWRGKTDWFYPNTNADLISNFISPSSQDTDLWKLQNSPLAQQSFGRINYWAFNQIKQWMSTPWSTSLWKTQSKPNIIDWIFVVECKSLICTPWNYSALGCTQTNFVHQSLTQFNKAENQQRHHLEVGYHKHLLWDFNTIRLQTLPWYSEHFTNLTSPNLTLPPLGTISKNLVINNAGTVSSCKE